MGASEQRQKPIGERGHSQAEGVPAEEGVVPSDIDERVDLDPDEQLNRPEQEDWSEEERRQYDDPDLLRPIAEAERPEDR
jgi:hypothetical protein